MSEKQRRQELLVELPFKEIAYPIPDAIQLLTTKTHQAVKKNIRSLMKSRFQALAADAYSRERLEEIITDPSIIVIPGGYSTNEKEINIIYEDLGKETFPNVILAFKKQIIPQFFEKPSNRNPAVTALGYYLDLINMIKPDYGTMKDKVAVFARTVHSDGYPPLLIGSMVDDSLNLRGTVNHPYELTIGKQDVSKFDQAYQTVVSREQLREYRRGISITYDEVLALLTGSTTS